MLLPDAEAKVLCDVRRLLTDVLVDISMSGLDTDSPMANKVQEARRLVREVMNIDPKDR